MRKARHMPLGIVAALALLASPLAAAAQSLPYRWTNVTVGAGGYAPGIVFSPAERGLAYLRTDMGGAYRWDAAAERWVPLQDGNAVSSYMGIESIAPDPHDPARVYMAAGMGAAAPAAILRSDDRGAHWTVTPVPFAMGGNEAGRGLGERLAIDPNRTRTLFFGSRHDGLWRSDDAGAHWAKVATFPVTGLGAPARRQTHGGVSFVLFDPTSGMAGAGSQRIWAGVADPGAVHLYRSEDGGTTWQAAAGPGAEMLAVKGAMAPDGTVYVGYATGIGQSDARQGALWRFSSDGAGRAITPPDLQEGGVLGVAVARSAPGTVAITTLDRYRLGDSLWLSRDGGAHWTDLGPRSRRDIAASPFLLHEGKGADFGHWITGLAIDPFDAGHIAYTTGATVYATDAAGAQTVPWAPWVRGIEQTAIITLISPTGGAHLVSGFGDLAGFVHDDLDVSPQPSFTNPYLSNTNTLDYAGLRPEVIVRSGSLYADRPRDASLGRSEDGGRSWVPVKVPAMGTPPARADLNGEAAISVSADGGTMLVAAPEPMLTRDGGKRWIRVEGLPGSTRATADKRDPARFYAVDDRHVLGSVDGGLHFAPLPGRGLPADLSAASIHNREQQSTLVASPFAAGELWLKLGPQLWRSTDSGKSFKPASGALQVDLFGLGKGKGAIPSVYAIGTMGGLRAIWRSDDLGAHWARINDDAHQWGLRFRVISGDPRVVGRVYLGTDGRGLFYGDPTGERK
ncbi:WD40/YVTN/BNR-like repeat-containing protein [Sphingomonas sp. RS6]